MPRLPDLDPAQLTPAQKAVYDRIVAGPRGRVEGPLRVWITSPEFAEKAQALGTFCRFGSSLPPRLSELAIIVMGSAWKAGFEWWAHAPLAKQGGISDSAIEAIRVGKTPTFSRHDETAVYAFAHELTHNKRVSQPTYDAAVTALGETSVVDLVGILGYYSMISMFINAFEVSLPAGEKDPFTP
jgi:4-carboxymuconolactone decarboxylase